VVQKTPLGNIPNSSYVYSAEYVIVRVGMSRKSQVIKTAISLTPVVLSWAKKLAEEKGFGANFSAYVADLIRRDNENAAARTEREASAVRIKNEVKIKNEP
jgi:hypothetical protein